MTTAFNQAADSTTYQAPRAASNTPLWAAVGVLSAAVLAMGGTLLYRQGAQSVTAPTAALSAAPLAHSAAKLASVSAPVTAADDLVEKPAAPVKKVVVKPAPRPAPAPRYVNATPQAYPSTQAYPSAQAYPSTQNGYPVSYPQQASVCSTCGSVESVNAVQRAVRPTSPISIGSVAGGVVGAVLGNQVGHGNGRKLATVVGAIGGGYAGHVIEGQVRKETVYQVGVRMEDGSRRTIEASSPPAIGSRVTVDGNQLQGGSYERRAAPIPVSYSQPAY